ncbi:urokinase plasminogen activator surface receptor isoform X1 [Mus musculus]|uniref:urokinase plasminogen activator surface receptor isoform X1 n=1 Tax=Mus musculus TaxID=10090 RepID=UPI0016743C5B|nr:urokinase plasminogen activator surface receptor isoform X1 [Mus musculus]
MGLPRRLLLLLLLATTCVPASQGLQCMQCESNQSCLVEECALGQDLCRTTVLREWQDDRELEVVTRGCAHSEKTNRTMSYRMGSMIISLTETVCATNLCNRPRPGARGRAFPQGRYLECASCTSLDQSCERGREQSLQCRYPTEHCIEVVTLQSTERSLKDEDYTRGCGSLPGCPGTAGFHSNQTFHFLKCCNYTHCNGGPVLGNRSYTVRGCATASWCQGSHVADSFPTHLNVSVSCCHGSGCNSPTGGAPRPGPAQLSLIASLLLTLGLWGVLLWT